MSDRTIIEAPPVASDARPASDRLVAAAALGGVALLFGAASLLWWREGLGVFADVILAGLAACF